MWGPRPRDLSIALQTPLGNPTRRWGTTCQLNFTCNVHDSTWTELCCHNRTQPYASARIQLVRGLEQISTKAHANHSAPFENRSNKKPQVPFDGPDLEVMQLCSQWAYWKIILGSICFAKYAETLQNFLSLGLLQRVSSEDCSTEHFFIVRCWSCAFLRLLDVGARTVKWGLQCLQVQSLGACSFFSFQLQLFKCQGFLRKKSYCSSICQLRQRTWGGSEHWQTGQASRREEQGNRRGYSNHWRRDNSTLHCVWRCACHFLSLLVILVSCIWKSQQDSNWYRDLKPILKKPESTKKPENTWHIQKLGRPRAHVTTHFFKAPSTSSTDKKSCSRVLTFLLEPLSIFDLALLIHMPICLFCDWIFSSSLCDVLRGRHSTSVY